MCVCVYIYIYVYNKEKSSVFGKLYRVYIICTPKWDAVGNSFFPLLSIMECYKLNRWRMFNLHSALVSSNCCNTINAFLESIFN